MLIAQTHIKRQTAPNDAFERIVSKLGNVLNILHCAKLYYNLRKRSELARNISAVKKKYITPAHISLGIIIFAFFLKVVQTDIFYYN